MSTQGNEHHEHRTFATIARDIQRDLWEQGKEIPFGAVPYLRAMSQMHTSDPDAMYGFDDMRGIVLYALSNLQTYRGERARALKAELKKVAGIK